MLLNEFHLQAYRGVRGLRLSNLGRINLLVGANNSGKTSVLEAASLLVRPIETRQWTQILLSRDSDQRTLRPEWVWGIFPNATALNFIDASPRCEPVQLEGQLHEVQRRFNATAVAEDTGERLENGAPKIRMKIDVKLGLGQEPRERHWSLEMLSGVTAAGGMVDDKTVPLYRSVLVTPIARSSMPRLVATLSLITAQGEKKLALDLLRLFDEQVENIEVTQPYGEARILVTHKTRGMVDLTSFGDGMRQALALALAVTTAREGLLLIDELEVGIHNKLLVEVLRHLLLASRKNDVQILCTTHSLEAVDALLEAAKTTSLLPEIVAFWLKRDAGGHTAQRFAGERLLGLREEGLDVRWQEGLC